MKVGRGKGDKCMRPHKKNEENQVICVGAAPIAGVSAIFKLIK